MDPGLEPLAAVQASLVRPVALSTRQVCAQLQLSSSAFYRRRAELEAAGLVRLPGAGHPRYAADSVTRLLERQRRPWRRAS